MERGTSRGLATVHANDTAAMLDRVCQLVDEVMPVGPRALIESKINPRVHLARDGGHPAGRRVTGIDEPGHR
jgi:type IV secretion system protein TrbB